MSRLSILALAFLSLPLLSPLAHADDAHPRAVVLHGSAPAALAVLDLATGDWDRLRGPAQVLELPVLAGEVARCQLLDVHGTRRSLWVATDGSLVELDVDTWRVGRNLVLPDEARGRVVDLALASDRLVTRVVLAVDAANGREPGLLVLNERSGEVVARYGASSAGMSRVYALHHEGDGWTLLNRRRLPSGLVDGAVTGLLWDGVGFAETTTSWVPDPGSLRGEAALTPLAPGIAVVPTPEMPITTLVDLRIPAGLEPHPFLEVTEEAVAAGADPALANPLGLPNLFIADAAFGEILALDGLFGQPRAAIPAELLGVRPTAGSALVVSGAAGRGLLSSPLDDDLLLFDAQGLVPLAVVPSLRPQPTAIVLLDR